MSIGFAQLGYLLAAVIGAAGWAAWIQLRRKDLIFVLLARLRSRSRLSREDSISPSSISHLPLPLPLPLPSVAEAPARLTGLLQHRANQPYLYVTGLALANFRCFADAQVWFRFPDDGLGGTLPNVNLLIGDNGSGKSTVLRAIGMACLGEGIEGSGYVPYQLVQRGTAQGSITAEFAFGVPGGPALLSNTVVVRRRGDLEVASASVAGEQWDRVFDEASPAFFVAGYGTNRRAATDVRADPSLERGRRRARYQRIAGLFDDTISLVPLGSWLPTARPVVQDEVFELIRELLPENFRFGNTFLGDEPIFSRSSVEVPLRAMSDGFRSYISWLGDLLFQLAVVVPRGQKLRDVGGIVLVDEVDLLLHPAWQRYVVSTVSRALPNIQFILTTHSPLVTGTLRASNVVVARDDEYGLASLNRIDVQLQGLSADQVLRSSYFELSSTRSQTAQVENLDRLKHRAVGGDIDDVVAYLRALEGAGPDDQT